MARYRVAVDVGGTFTDLFVHDEESGAVSITKTPSTPANPAIGILDALRKANVDLRQMVFFSHGSTIGTNALITRRFPRTALVTTRGFRDVLEIRLGNRPHLWDAYQDVPEPYVKRRDRLEVTERIDYSGRVLTPLDEDEVREVGRILRRRGIRSVAISFINAYMNGAHERRAREILQQELPEAFICTSHEVLPEVFEHQRTSTTVINACLAPVVSDYLADLSRRLREGGFTGDVLVLHSGGGVMTAEGMARFAVRIANSGPTAGAAAGAYIGRLCGYQNVIGLDMGGTSADVSLTYQGQTRMAREWQVEFGYPIMFPTVEVVAIGAGGGSVAWIDEGGSLRNGPQSMGADPGPAAYGRGGDLPTNTDANLVLGRLNPATFLGGQMRVDVGLAERAIAEKIAAPLGFDTVRAADAIIKVANANMADAVRLISIRRGYDPREFALVAFGGAGPVHAVAVAQDLGIPTVIVPHWPGITSALGCLLLDVRHDLSRTYLLSASEAEAATLEREFARMEAEAREHLRAEGVPEERMELQRQLDMRYVGQWRSLTVAAPRPLAGSFQAALEAFHREHQREYAYSRPEQPVEVYGLRVTGVGRVDKPELPRYAGNGSLDGAVKGARPVYFEEAGGFTRTTVYDRDALAPGASFQGPAIVEQMDSTVVVPPGVRATVDDYRNIILAVQG